MRRNPFSAVCAVFLMLSLAVLPARAAQSWPDLSAEHWAYGIMSRAYDLEIVTGTADGAMQPEAVLSWGEYLAMLYRTFLSDSPPHAVPDNAHWAYGYYMTARISGILQDYMPVTDANLSTPVSRQDAAVLAVCALEGNPLASPDPAAADFFQLPADYRPGVARAYALGLLTGYPDGTFGGNGTLSRAQGAAILLRALDCQPPSAQPDPPDSDPFFSALPGMEPFPALEPEPAIPSEDGAWDTWDTSDTWSSWDNWDYSWGYWDGWSFGSGMDYGGDPLKWPGENTQKYLRLFGREDKRRFDSREEAEANMVTVTVPVWRLSGGVKSPGTASFSIHKALSDEIVEIFTEIYNDPEQFPMQDVGAYSWRGDSATGEHNCGTAIDINSNENYQVQDGQARAGSLWQPGVNPYSIPADGSVVRIFAEHGWSWGGDAWAMDTDPTAGYHDYMHFSYMGG